MLIQHIRKLYIDDSISIGLEKWIDISTCTSCENTSLYIICRLQNLNIIKYSKSMSFKYNNHSDFLNTIFSQDYSFMMEIILFRRSHTFIIVKDGNKVYLVDSYLNIHTSRITKFENFEELMKDIYEIEFENNIDKHCKIFNIEKFPCLSLDIKYARIDINLYDNNYSRL
jgi:hypothetical protein